MSAEPAQEAPKTVEPIQENLADKPNHSDKYFYTMFFLSLTVLIFIVITTVSGQWVKLQHTAADNDQHQVNLWEYCQCQRADVAFGCTTKKNIFRTTSGFSVIALGCQFIAITIFAAIFADLPGNKQVQGLVAIVFSWLAVISLLLSWTTYLGLYNQHYCNNRLREYGYLHWAFGLRIAEFTIWILISALFSMYGTRADEKKQRFLRNSLFLAVFIFGITVATTAGRGWVYNKHDKYPLSFQTVAPQVNASITHLVAPNLNQDVQVSLWEACVCQLSGDFTCKETRRLFRGQQAFSIISIFTQALLVFFIIFSLPRFTHVILSFLAAGSILITWVVFAEWFNSTHCGTPSPASQWQLNWPFGLNICAFIINAVVFIISIVGACGNF